MHALAVPLLGLLAGAEVDNEPWWAPLGGSVTLEASVGSGTFVAHDKSDDPYYASTLYLAPSWSLAHDAQLSLALDFTYEWTALVTPCQPASGPRAEGAPEQDCSDTGDPNGRRESVSDLELAVGTDAILEWQGVKMSGSAGLAFPTSRESRALRNLLTASVGAGLSRPFGPVTPKLGFSARKFFPRENAPVLDAAELDSDIPIGRCASFRQTSCILLSGFAPNWRLAVEGSILFDVVWVEGLSVSATFRYAYSRKFSASGSSSTRMDANGVPIVDGVNDEDTTSGGLEVGYALSEQWSLAGGVASTQPARTEDGQSIRFPFFDFVSAANNYTGFYAYASYSL